MFQSQVPQQFVDQINVVRSGGLYKVKRDIISIVKEDCLGQGN